MNSIDNDEPQVYQLERLLRIPCAERSAGSAPGSCKRAGNAIPFHQKYLALILVGILLSSVVAEAAYTASESKSIHNTATCASNAPSMVVPSDWSKTSEAQGSGSQPAVQRGSSAVNDNTIIYGIYVPGEEKKLQLDSLEKILKILCLCFQTTIFVSAPVVSILTLVKNGLSNPVKKSTWLILTLLLGLTLAATFSPAVINEMFFLARNLL